MAASSRSPAGSRPAPAADGHDGRAGQAHPGRAGGGDDTYDLIDNALGGRRGAWLGDDITAIILIARLISALARLIFTLVLGGGGGGHFFSRLQWQATLEPARGLGQKPIRRLAHARTGART